jgi:hypothetical protein
MDNMCIEIIMVSELRDGSSYIASKFSKRIVWDIFQ